MTHQELLDHYIVAKQSVIGEFSGDMLRDWRALVAEVEEYAARNGLNTDALVHVRSHIADSEACE